MVGVGKILNEFKPKTNDYLVKVLSGRRITIPQDWLDKRGLKEGDFIGFEEDKFSKRLLIIPLDIIPRGSEKSD